jgi:hypothetical protein
VYAHLNPAQLKLQYRHHSLDAFDHAGRERCQQQFRRVDGMPSMSVSSAMVARWQVAWLVWFSGDGLRHQTQIRV